jgi:hypothetical protein
MKQVITAEKDGKAYFVEPPELEPFYSRGFGIWRLGGHPKLPVELPSSGLEPETGPMFPDQDGFRVYYTEIPPESEEPRDDGIPGLADAMDEDGFHATETVDVVWILGGEVGLELPDAVEWLTAGDVVIQNGTVHVWRNRSAEVGLLGTISLGAKRR